jgi:drug/metabolite transporter (DMT)-like permease
VARLGLRPDQGLSTSVEPVDAPSSADGGGLTRAGSAARLAPGAAVLLLALCVLWGGNMIAIKISSRGIPPALAAGIRSAGAAGLLAAFAAVRRQRLWVSRRMLLDGAVIGTLFGAEFLCMYLGVSYTSASRATILAYTTPLWLVLGAHALFPDDRLSVNKVLGLVLSFAGIVAVFGAHGGDLAPNHWVGDLLELGAAFFWAATTLYVKRMTVRQDPTALQLLFYQLAFSAPLLLGAAVLLEGGRLEVVWRADAVLSLLYQTVIVASISYLAWFRLIQRYHVTSLGSFTFLSPLFGVILGGVLLGEELPALLWAGLALAGAGIYVVNRPPRSAALLEPESP